MKKIALFLVLFSCGAAFADSNGDILSMYLEKGRRSCTLNFDVQEAMKVSTPGQFPGVPVGPGPGVGSVVVGPSDFYSQGTVECGRASAALIKAPNANWACVISSGPYQTAILGLGTSNTEKSAAKSAIRDCILRTNATETCFFQKEVACFSRK